MVDEDSSSLRELLSNNSGVTPGVDLDDLKIGVMKAMSSLPETDKIATAFCLEENLNEASARRKGMVGAFSKAVFIPLICVNCKREWVRFGHQGHEKFFSISGNLMQVRKQTVAVPHNAASSLSEC